MPTPPSSPSLKPFKTDATVKSEPLSQAVKPSSDLYDTDEMPLLTRPALLPYKFVAPGKFSGISSGDYARDTDTALSWMDSMDDYLRQSKLVCSPWSTLLEAEIAMSMLELDARK